MNVNQELGNLGASRIGVLRDEVGDFFHSCMVEEDMQRRHI